MTNVQTPTGLEARPEPIIDQTQASADEVKGAQHYLAPIVWDLQALAISGKQAHWHVRGQNFIAVHELLDDVVDHAREFADLAAERTVALGLPIDARLQTIAAKSTLPPQQEGFQNYGPTIQQVVADIDAAVATVRAAIEGLEEIDPASQDVATEIERGLVKDRWFLSAHLATD